MNFIVEGHEYQYEVQTIIQVFYPNENYAVLDSPSESGITILSRLQANEDICCAVIFDSGEKILEKSLNIYDNNEKEIKRIIKLTIFYCLENFTLIKPPWGIMTGIRPAKRVYDFWKQGLSDDEIRNILQEQFLVKPNKVALAIQVARVEAKILDKNDGTSIGIYAGIPFCPTRCLYCSFAAYSIEKYQHKVDIYLDALIKELEFVKQYSDRKYVESFYIGGGTPTALNDTQLERLLRCIGNNFDIEEVKEFTVEAGRPDTITREKLRLLKKYGVSRISINPQTMNQNTLDIIGRKHTIEQFFDAYQMATEEGFENINIDLILGLPNEKLEDVQHTMKSIMQLAPVSITIHTLAIKRASELKGIMTNIKLASSKEMEEMIAISSIACKEMGLEPYYMYRQKNSSGNFENVGYAKKGYECIYNVQIMGEKQTIIATGAGAATKTVNLAEDRIERVFNVKNVDEYITRIDEMLERKQRGVNNMIQAPKGTADTFGEEVYAWQQVENVIRRLCSDFCIEEIRTPTFESVDLYKRGVGETTDVVQKEMFTFIDRGGRNFSLRPEITAGVARAFIQNGMKSQPQPTKLYYLSNAFRAERPQKGRMVELHQFGVEILGSYNAASDAEVISVAAELLRRLNVKNVELRINSLGNVESRARYNETLKKYIFDNIEQLCPTCKERVDRNPLRVLDCKNANCQKIMGDAPSVLDSLGEECKEHFQSVQDYLTAMGLAFVVDDRIVRGLDYYTRTVFEFVSIDLGAQSTVCGGGRYDGLIEEVGGDKTGACGFGLGIERLLIILQAQGNKPSYKPSNDIYIGSIGDKGFKKAQALVYELRRKGISAEGDTLGRGVKAQMKYADKIGARYSFIIGDDELESNSARVKDMTTGEQTVVKFMDIAEFIKK